MGQFQGQSQGQFWVNYFVLTNKSLFQLLEFNAPGLKVNFGTISGIISGTILAQNFWVNYLVLTI